MPATDGSPRRPNILLFLVDDMGFSDIGCYGAEIATPHLDALARRGVRFAQAYNCARCCPTRASLLTGLYPHQAGVGHMVNHRSLPAYQGYLHAHTPTIADVLRGAGYRTGLSGKWHVGGQAKPHDPATWKPGSETQPGPLDRGFDRFYGTLGGAGSFWRPPMLMDQDQFITPDSLDYYYTDAISEQACGMIRESVAAGQPFFQYVAYTAPHWPLHAPRDLIEDYRGRYRQGWDALRTSRHEALKATGIIDPRWPISARDPDNRPWDDDPADRQEWEDLRMATYAAMITKMDEGVGRILATLDELGERDDTLVIFLSDNGGCAEFLREDSAHMENYKIPNIDGSVPKVGNHVGLMPGDHNTFMSYDLPWANASNAPFRLFKSWTHEGGIATPMIVDYPAWFAAHEDSPAGDIVASPCHVVDLAPTIYEFTGARFPAEHAGQTTKPLAGESFAPALTTGAWERQKPIFWEHQGNRALRHGDLKLVSAHGSRGQFTGEWELYDMAANRTETEDRARDLSADRDRLAQCYEELATAYEVHPWEDLPAAAKAR